MSMCEKGTFNEGCTGRLLTFIKGGPLDGWIGKACDDGNENDPQIMQGNEFVEEIYISDKNMLSAENETLHHIYRGVSSPENAGRYEYQGTEV